MLPPVHLLAVFRPANPFEKARNRHIERGVFIGSRGLCANDCTRPDESQFDSIVAVLAANLAADFVYVFLDPRTRQEA